MGQHLVATGMKDDDSRIELLELPVRTYNCLKRSGISTVRQLFSLQKQELFSLRGLTSRDIEELREHLIARRFLDSEHPHGPFTNE